MNTNLVKKLWAALLLACLLVTPAQAETVTYLHTDLLGSVVLETDQNRNVVARYEYEPYGLPRQAIADDLVGGAEYSSVPSIQGGVNSNSAAGAIAQRSDEGSTSVENGRSQPGSEQSAVDRVEFRESERKGK